MTLKRYDSYGGSLEDDSEGRYVELEDVINLVQEHMDWSNLKASQYAMQKEAPESIQFWKDKACAYDVLLHILKKA